MDCRKDWTLRTLGLGALAPLLLLLAGQPVAARQDTGSAGPQTLPPDVAPAAPESNGESGIQVFDTPESSAAIQAADRRLEQQLQAHLEADPWVLSYQVHLGVRQGVVTLEGKVDTLLAKERAAQVAETIPGVRAVSNNLLVVLPPRSDWMIHEEVKVWLLRSPALKHSQVGIEVAGGVVALSGMVDSEYRKQLAGVLAKSVTGVCGVENKLRVNRLAPRSDRDIQVDVESRLKWDPGLLNPQIGVKVHHRIVQLAGMVESRRGKERAVQDAHVAGVRAVEASGLAIWQETAEQ